MAAKVLKLWLRSGKRVRMPMYFVHWRHSEKVLASLPKYSVLTGPRALAAFGEKEKSEFECQCTSCIGFARGKCESKLSHFTSHLPM